MVVAARKMGPDVVAWSESRAPGLEVPMPTLPCAVRMKKVEVAVGLVDDAMVKRGRAPRAGTPATDRRAQGDEVPIPKRLSVVSIARKFAESMVFDPE